jgi:hypothetical protein
VAHLTCDPCAGPATARGGPEIRARNRAMLSRAGNVWGGRGKVLRRVLFVLRRSGKLQPCPEFPGAAIRPASRASAPGRAGASHHQVLASNQCARASGGLLDDAVTRRPVARAGQTPNVFSEGSKPSSC